ncbi:MAG: DUF99 family protein [Arenicella sp.]
MNNIVEAIRLNKRLRIIGFDDAPFSKQRDTDVNVSGIVCSNTRFEGMVWGKLSKDGTEATSCITQLVTQNKFHSQLHAVLLDGIAFGGFNIVDLLALAHDTQLPCIAVMRRHPDLQAVDKALRNFDDYEYRRELIHKAGEIEQYSGFVFQCRGIEPELAGILLQRVTDTGNVPEALRLAHLIGSAVKTGVSGKRA